MKNFNIDMMENFEKADEISMFAAMYENDFDKKTEIRLQRYNAAMLMAEWKDEQLESKLMQIIILAQQGYTSGATDEMILKQCKEIIKE